jgi:hypothetical protein
MVTVITPKLASMFEMGLAMASATSFLSDSAFTSAEILSRGG